MRVVKNKWKTKNKEGIDGRLLPLADSQHLGRQQAVASIDYESYSRS